MPTRVEVELPLPSQQEVSDASETILLDESTILVDGNGEEFAVTSQHTNNEPILPDTNRTVGDKNETFDGSVTILSRTLLSHHDTPEPSRDENHLNISKSCIEKTVTVAEEKKGNTNESYDDAANLLNISYRYPERETLSKGANEVSLGTQQQLYRAEYQEFVQSTISAFKARFPGRLRDYRTISLEEKELEQKNVLHLLSSLGINNKVHSSRDATISEGVGTKERQGASHMYHHSNQDNPMSQVLSPKFHEMNSSSDTLCYGREKSPICPPHAEPLLVTQKAPFFSAKCSPIERNHSPSFNGTSLTNMSIESVELVRGERSVSSCSNHFESPRHLARKPQKRMASSSGKRGTDLVRQKYNEEITPPVYELEGDIDTDIALSSHLERMSMSPASSGHKDLFLASQSPISPRFTYGSSGEEDSSDEPRSRTILHHRAGNATFRPDDTLDTFNSTLRYQRDRKEERRTMREIPMNVRLRAGATFHLDKLEMKQTERRVGEGVQKIKGYPHHRLIDFPDPLVRYNKRQRKMLKDVFKIVLESDSEAQGKCILFSLSYEQIVDVNMKLLLNDEASSQLNSSKFKSHALLGKTAIVVRTKEDLSRWESNLREGTGCSVLNHATLPLAERTRVSTAERATMYDIVLTTYDALKSPDMVIPVDGSGQAILQKVGSSNGWYTSRSTSQADSMPQKCKELSVLHRIKFNRIVFTDVLGRKSFLAKEGTARATAAIALRGDSR